MHDCDRDEIHRYVVAHEHAYNERALNCSQTADPERRPRHNSAIVFEFCGADVPDLPWTAGQRVNINNTIKQCKIQCKLCAINSLGLSERKPLYIIFVLCTEHLVIMYSITCTCNGVKILAKSTLV